MKSKWAKNKKWTTGKMVEPMQPLMRISKLLSVLSVKTIGNSSVKGLPTSSKFNQSKIPKNGDHIWTL